MTREELYEIVKDAVNDAELRSGDIPAIDLYVDQILNLVAEKLKGGSERYHDRQLTKTMINNYTKNDLLPFFTIENISDNGTFASFS